MLRREARALVMQMHAQHAASVPPQRAAAAAAASSEAALSSDAERVAGAHTDALATRADVVLR